MEHNFDIDDRLQVWPNALGFYIHVSKNSVAVWPSECYEKHDVIGKILYYRMRMITSPENVEFILKKGAKHFLLDDLQHRLLEPALGQGLILAEGDKWFSLRRQSSRFIRPTCLDQVADLCKIAAQNAAHQLLKENRPIDLVLAEAFLKIFGKAFFDATKEDTIGVSESVEQYIENAQRVAVSTFLGLPKFLSLSAKKQLSLAHSLDERFDSALELRDLKSVQPTKAARRDFVINLMTGYKTTSVAAFWTLICLAKAQSHFEPCRIAGEKHLNAPDEDKDYLDGAIDEATRLFPPLPLIMRTPKSDILLPSGDIAKPKEKLIISPWIVHRHKLLWDDPDRFIPLRHLEGDIRAPFFIPFGMGARLCPGQKLGTFALKEFLANLLQLARPIADFDKIKPKGGFILRPDDNMKIKWQKVGKA